MEKEYEYARSAGEGTLIDHGLVTYNMLRRKQQEALRKGYTMIFRRV